MSEQFLAQAQIVVKADTAAARKEILDLNKLKVKPIPVRIEPVSTGFLSQLRKDVNTAAGKAPARVPVLPDPKGFLGLLRTEVATAAEKVFAAIRMVADPTGFRAGLEAEALAASKGVVAPISATISTIVPGTGKAATQAAAVSVPAVPVVNEAEFRTLLQAQVDKAALGVTAKVPAVPVAPTGEATRKTRQQATTPASGSTGKATQKVADATVKATRAEQAFTSAQNASAFARKKLDASMSIEEKRLERLAREKIALAQAEKAVTLAREEGNAALLSQAQAQRTAAAGVVAKTEGTIARAAAPAAAAAQAEKDEAARIKAAKAAETQMARDHAAALRENQRLDKAAEAQRVRDHAAALKENAALDKAAADQRIAFNKRADAIIAETRKIAPAGQPGQPRPAPPAVLGAAQAAAIKQEAKLQKIRERGVTVASQVSNAEKFVSAEANKVTAARQSLSQAQAAENAALRNFNAALTGSQVALKNSTADTYANARALTVQKTAALQAAEAGVASQKVFSFRARGFGSQIASFVGLRGAVLAANAQFIAGTVAAIAFGKAIGAAARLESELNVFKVTAGATADQMVRVSDAAKDLGRDVSLPAVSAGSAAQAMTELSKAGLSVEDSIAGARGVLQLATAAQLDNAQATQFAASALNAFGLAGSDAVHVADVLTNAANASQGSIADMAIAMQQASAVARQVGISFEDTVGFLTLLSKAGIQGSDAGTSLRVAFTRLINPTDKAQEVINKLGISLRDVQGNIRPEVFTDFAAAQAGLSKKQQDANAAIVFGTDALRAYSIIARAGVAGFNQVATSLERQGSAAELANARMAGLAGSAENLKNQLSTAGLAIGQAFAPALKSAADLGAELASTFSDAVTAVTTIVKDIENLRKQAEKPIDLIINIIRREEGGGAGGGAGGELGVSDRVQKDTREFLTNNLPKMVFRGVKAFEDLKKAKLLTDAALEDSTGFDFVTFPTVKQARKEIQGLTADVNKFRDPPAFNRIITRLKEMQREMAGGTDETKQFARNLGPFIKQLQKASESPQIKPFVKPRSVVLTSQAFVAKGPVEIPGFAIGEKTTSDAGRSVIEGIRKKLSGADVFGIAGSFFDKLTVASTTSGQRFVHSGELTAKAFGEEVQKGLQTAFLLAVAEVNQGTQALTNAMNQAIIAGAGTATLRGIAQKQLNAALKIVANAQKRLDAIPKTAANKARRKKAQGILNAALEQAAGLTGTVKGFTDQIASDAKSKADAIKDAREKADQAILDSFAPARARLSDAAARAAATPRGEDDITVQLALIAQIKRERDTISKTVKNIKTKTTEMRARTSELNQAVLDLKELRKKRDEAIIAAIAQEFAPRIAFAEATGNTSLLIRLLDQEIARINKEIRLAKKAKRSTQVLETALADLQETRNQTQDDLLAALRERAELRLEAGSGSRNAVINAINKQIAQKERERRAVKKFGLKWVQLGNDILQLQADRKEALNAAKETSGLTVFELLKQNVETFNAVGGNLIQGNQPFPGPTGFTADVAQWLVAQKSRPNTNLTPGAAGKTKIEINDDRLVRGLDRLADVVERQWGGGNQTAGTQQTSVEGQRWNAIGEFWQSRRTRMAIQADPTS